MTEYPLHATLLEFIEHSVRNSLLLIGVSRFEVVEW
jgi:hypothetical protein